MQEQQNKKESTLKVKVPVYTTEVIENPNDLFGGMQYSNMIEYARKKIDDFNVSGESIKIGKSDKTIITEISNITSQEFALNNIPYLLIRLSAYELNDNDRTVITKETIKLSPSDKVGHENNYFILFPSINGLAEEGKSIQQWFVFIYEEPNKIGSELIRVVKRFLRIVMDMPVKNIKPAKLLEELEKQNNYPTVELTLTAISNDIDEINIIAQEYAVSSYMRKAQVIRYEKMPKKDLIELVTNNTFFKNIFKIKTCVIKTGGKKDFKYKAELDEANEELNEKAEEIFNMSFEISQAEKEDLYKPEFITTKISDVIKNYLTSYNE
ncbi:MAG: hypothetical protein JNM95_12220 [Chitinophagaceae bacterium]|jgi:hypothetical protein|nr:hypothetical protein [Chitinophagaceae bacterium]